MLRGLYPMFAPPGQHGAALAGWRTQGRALLLSDRARAEGLARSVGAGLHATAFALNARPLPRTSSAARRRELHAIPELHAMVCGQTEEIMIWFILAARSGPFAGDAV